MMSFIEIQKEVEKLGSLAEIPKPKYFWRVYNSSPQDGTPHIEIKHNEYHYVSCERGTEFSREVFDSIDDVLYLIIRSHVSNYAYEFELQNRIDSNVDCRRVSFQKQIEIMTKIKPEWGQKTVIQIDEILKNAPYSK